MKSNALTLSFFLFLFILGGCNKKEDNPVSPADGTTVAEGNIGTSGGTLSSSEISLTIPPNTLASVTEIKISEVEQKYSGENSYSKTYKLEGIPLNYSGVLKMKIKYSKPLENLSFLTCYSKTLTNSLDSQVVSRKHFSGEDSSGFFISEMDLSGTKNTMGKQSGSSREQEIILVDINSDMKEEKQTTADNLIIFDFIYPASVPSDFIRRILGYFVSIQEIYRNMGFSYTARDNKELFPVYVTNDPNAADYGFYNRSFPWTINGSYIELNYALCGTNDTETRSLIAHEFFHFVHNCYGMNDNATWWYQDALCSWAEELLQPDPKSYYSPQFLKFYMRPFLGMEAGKEWFDPADKLVSYQRHGYGMGALVKYFINSTSNSKGNIIAFDLVNKVSAQNNSPVEAMMNSFNNFKVQWRTYYNDFFAGTLPFIKASTTKEKLLDDFGKRTWILSAASDTAKSFTEEMEDLSADVYRIHLDREITEGEVLTIKTWYVSDISDCEVSVYKYKNTNMGGFPVLINKVNAGTEINITDLKSIRTDYGSIMIVVTNSRAVKPFTGKTKFEIAYLVGKVNNSTLTLLKKMKWLRVTFSGTHQFKKNDGSGSFYQDLTLSIPDHYSSHDLGDVALNWGSNSFQAEFTRKIPAYPNDSWNIKFNGTLSSDGKTLLEFTAEETLHQGSLDWNKKFYVRNVPFVSYDPYAYGGPAVYFLRSDSGLKFDLSVKHEYSLENYVTTDWTKAFSFSITFKQQ